MKAKTSAHYQREFRKRLRDQGLLKKEVWIRPENAKNLSEVEKKLRLPLDQIDQSSFDQKLAGAGSWTTANLFDALKTVELFKADLASVEKIHGVEPILYIVMHEFGDLPIFLTVSGEQIIAESVLWPATAVKNTNQFNEVILRTYKYFPLSTINLEKSDLDGDYYYMFGALSARSVLTSVVFEIETLAANVIQATEEYSEFLKISILE